MYLTNFRHVDAFHSVSESLANAVLEYNICPDKVSVIRTPLKISTFNYFSLPIDHKIETLQIVSVGRYHWVKGYSYAINAIKHLHDKGINVEYFIIAPNTPSEELLFLVQALGLESVVKFKAAMPQQDLLKTLKIYDIMLLPSVSEGIANVVVEAMAIGLPVISTDCGGMSELIVNEYNGWLVPIRNTEAISETLFVFSQLSNNKKIDVINNAHHDVLKRFHEDVVGSEFRELYEKTLKL